MNKNIAVELFSTLNNNSGKIVPAGALRVGVSFFEEVDESKEGVVNFYNIININYEVTEDFEMRLDFEERDNAHWLKTPDASFHYRDNSAAFSVDGKGQLDNQDAFNKAVALRDYLKSTRSTATHGKLLSQFYIPFDQCSFAAHKVAYSMGYNIDPMSSEELKFEHLEILEKINSTYKKYIIEGANREFLRADVADCVEPGARLYGVPGFRSVVYEHNIMEVLGVNPRNFQRIKKFRSLDSSIKRKMFQR